MPFIEHPDCPPVQSSGSLRFKISLSKQEMEHEKSESSVDDSLNKTSYSLYVVLSEIHRLCVKRDQKGIFANPVTEVIAPDYFSVVSHPMDLSTISSRLESRNFYSTAGQYLADLRLMCQNAMCYNPLDTIYYQRARKLLAFAEKQMTPHNLRKLSSELLKMCRPLTHEEIGEKFEEHHYHQRHHQSHSQRHRLEQPSQQSAQSSTSTIQQSTALTDSALVSSKLQEEEEGAMEEIEEEVKEKEDEEESEAMPMESSYSPALSLRKRRPSSTSMSSTGKVPRYSNSPPLLVPEVEDLPARVDSPLTQSTCGPNDSDVITIDLEATEIDPNETSFTLSSASSTISINTVRGTSRKSKRHGARKNISTPTLPPRPSTTSKPRRRTGYQSSTSQPPGRLFNEDVWTFSNSLTDRSSPGKIPAQVKRAAQLARAKFLARYGKPGHQTVVYLDTSETGKIYARPCRDGSGAEGVEKEGDDGKLVDYPLALRQLLTPRPRSNVQGVYHGLVEQMTSQQVATLHALSTLRYDPSEPVAMGIHAPLAGFEKDDLAQLCDAYGGDTIAVESVISLLTFVEPLGEWARRWAHRRLNDATEGYHGKMLLAFEDPSSELHMNNWFRRAKFTLDCSILEEFKTQCGNDLLNKSIQSSLALIETTGNSPQSSASPPNEFQTMDTDSSGQMSIAKLPSNTFTTSTTVKQMTTFQPHQHIAAISSTSSDDKSDISNTVAVFTTEAEQEEAKKGPFDILSAAFNASLTPTASDQTPKQQSQHEQYVLSTYRAMEGDSSSSVMETSDKPKIIPNPLAASVNEIAQISALTAAISPIQPTATLPATCIGLSKKFQISVTGGHSSTLLVIDREMGKCDVALEESSSMLVDLEPCSAESAKSSALLAIPLKNPFEDGHSGDSAESPIGKSRKECSTEVQISTELSASPKIIDDINLPSFDEMIDQPMLPRTDIDASIINEPKVLIADKSSESLELETSVKMATYRTEQFCMSPHLEQSSFAIEMSHNPSDQEDTADVGIMEPDGSANQRVSESSMILKKEVVEEFSKPSTFQVLISVNPFQSSASPNFTLTSPVNESSGAIVVSRTPEAAESTPNVDIYDAEILSESCTTARRNSSINESELSSKALHSCDDKIYSVSNDKTLEGVNTVEPESASIVSPPSVEETMVHMDVVHESSSFIKSVKTVIPASHNEMEMITPIFQQTDASIIQKQSKLSSTIAEFCKRDQIQVLDEKRFLPSSVIFPPSVLKNQQIATNSLQSVKCLERSTRLCSQSPIAISHSVEAELANEPSYSDSHAPSTLQPAEIRVSSQLLLEDCKRIFAPALDRSSSEPMIHNSSPTGKLVDHECTESSENEVPSRSIAKDAPIDISSSLQLPGSAIELGIAVEVETPIVKISSCAFNLQDASSTSITAKFSPSSFINSDGLDGLEVISREMEDNIQIEADDVRQSYPCQCQAGDLEPSAEEPQAGSYMFAPRSASLDDEGSADIDVASISDESVTEELTG